MTDPTAWKHWLNETEIKRFNRLLHCTIFGVPFDFQALLNSRTERTSPVTIQTTTADYGQNHPTLARLHAVPSPGPRPAPGTYVLEP